MTESAIPANFVVAFNPSVVSAIQDRTLIRVFRDALFPRLLYRGEASPEMWPVNLGANQTFTRTGLIRPSTRPLQQNQDPTPKTYEIEQWEASAKQYGDTIDTHMPTSYVSLASTYLRNMHQLGMHAGQSLNRIVRDKVYNAYTAGQTLVGSASAGTTVRVVSLNGFTRRLFNGRPALVSSTNPLPVDIITGGGTTRVNVTGFTADQAGNELGGGTLTIDQAVTVASPASGARDRVVAVNHSRTVQSNGKVSTDALVSADQFELADIRAAVAQMRADNVPTHEDGMYHCHLDPISESQIFGDETFTRLNQSIPDYVHYREFALAAILGTVFYRNTEAPLASTVDTDPQFGGTFAPETANNDGVPIHRPLFTGLGYIEEKYLDEARYISEAGIMGKIGEFAVVNNGIQVMTERVRLILRSPQDRLQQNTSTSWSWSGDWPLPTDEATLSTPASFKRAVVVQHGE